MGLYCLREGLPYLMMSVCCAYTDDSQSGTLFIVVGRGEGEKCKEMELPWQPLELPYQCALHL